MLITKKMAPKELPYEDLESGGDVYRRKKLYNACINVGIGAIYHPLNYANVLMQLGHEPLPVQMGKRWLFFGRTVSFYPNVFHYMAHIKQKSGLLGLYNGVTASVCGSLLDVGLTLTINNHLDDMFPLEGSGYETFGAACSRFVKMNIKQTLAKVVGVTVARPLKVVMIRNMAQFIGGEVMYRGLFGPLKVTYIDEGFAGIFSGLVSQLINELCVMWTSSLALFLFEKLYNHYLLDPDDEEYDTKAKSSSAGQIFDLVLPHVVTSLFYPFDLVSSVMAVNGSRLSVGRVPSIPIFTRWLDCWDHLSIRNQLKRGNHLFMRIINEESIVKKM